MRASRLNLILIVLAVVLSGCAALSHDRRTISITATIVDPEYLVLESFTNGGYNEEGVILKIESPVEMRGELIAVPIRASFGKKVTLAGDFGRWRKPAGALVQFEVRHRDILEKRVMGHRQIYFDKIRNLEWPIQPPEPTRAAVRDSGGSPAITVSTSSARAAHL